MSKASHVVPADSALDPIVVYGAPRSGTTYLSQVLSAHPAVFITSETRVFGWLYHALELLPLDGRLVQAEREAFVGHLRRALPQVIHDFYRTLAPDVRYWGDKNPLLTDPFNAGSLETVAELFPGSRFIHIVRDGRDVASSTLRRRGEGKSWMSFEQAHLEWVSRVDRGTSFAHTLVPDRSFELSLRGPGR